MMQLSWGPLLKDVSRIDESGLEKSNRSISEASICYILTLEMIVI